MKKRNLKLFLIIGFVFFLINLSSALRVVPGKIEFDFHPNLEKTILYSASQDNPERDLILYVEGDLAEYVKLDKEKLVGGGTFTATLNLPEEIEIPGKHRIFIVVRETLDEEVVGTTIVGLIAIKGVIDIHVPYPGRYLEITSFKSSNVNLKEPVYFELEISNKGKEDLTITPRIEITSLNKTIENLYFNERLLKVQDEVKLKKTLDSTDYNPGTYMAFAFVDYGKIAQAESEFKIGELIINILNHTEKIIIGGLHKFNIEIESGWNDNIEGAYAEVSFLNNSKSMFSFKTSSTSLTPWQKKNITGYFDTRTFEKGVYDANITLFYYGKSVGKSSSKLVKIEFIKETSKLLIAVIVAGILFLLVLVVAIIFSIRRYFLKNYRRRSK
jgi:hypothetical protein